MSDATPVSLTREDLVPATEGSDATAVRHVVQVVALVDGCAA
jgi:hypothetical protein